MPCLMVSSMERIEFFNFEDEVWYRNNDGANEKLTDASPIVPQMIEKIEQFYPKAYKALCAEYDKCKLNLRYFRFKIVNRFCKCNFGSIDNVPDVKNGVFNFERVPCPLRGECRLEGVVCGPEFENKVSNAEMRVMKLVHQSKTAEEIADELYLSVFTVRNHLRNIYSRLGLHNRQELMTYIHKNKLFEDE